MIGKRTKSFVLQCLRKIFCVLARKTIDDDGLIFMFRKKNGEPIQNFFFWFYRIKKIGTIKRRKEDARFGHIQILQNILTYARCCSGCQGNNIGPWKYLTQTNKFAIFGSKIMTPFTNTMSLINSNEAHGQCTKKRLKSFC